MKDPTATGSSGSGVEEDLWRGTPSHWTGFWVYALGGVFLLAGLAGAVVGRWGARAAVPLGLIVMGIQYLGINFTRYRLTSQRLILTRGIFNRHTEEIELFRVKDLSMTEPFFYRLVRLGNLHLVTTDARTPTVTLRAVPGVETLRDLLRLAVERRRAEKDVREIDIE